MADANYENVVLLLHANGVNGSTQIRDERGHAVTCNGNAAISTTQSKFGGSSLGFDGTGDFTADSAANLEALKRWNTEQTISGKRIHR